MWGLKRKDEIVELWLMGCYCFHFIPFLRSECFDSKQEHWNVLQYFSACHWEIFEAPLFVIHEESIARGTFYVMSWHFGMSLKSGYKRKILLVSINQ